MERSVDHVNSGLRDVSYRDGGENGRHVVAADGMLGVFSADGDVVRVVGQRGDAPYGRISSWPSPSPAAVT